jgi:2-polyprenyl-3-methyl-5-hydroxy-6-metoxy-1,4-benzoquinol methylase
MDYYSQLYDVNFFSCDEYNVKVGTSSITIFNPGNPNWETWVSRTLNKRNAIEIWDNFNNISGNLSDLLLFNSNISEDDFYLLALILCEDSYRKFNNNLFYFLNRILYTSNNVTVRLKATKLQYAWISLFRLSESMNPLKKIIGDGLNYLNEKWISTRKYETRDIKIEVPVREDWIHRRISIHNKDEVINFYKETCAYILELIAANHQVETLYNYYIIIEALQRLGVSNCLDYGAGIGTFLFLAEKSNMNCTYSDICSETMTYARSRAKKLNSEIKFFNLEPSHYAFPGQFDCIVCTEVLEHVFEPEALVSAIYRTLRPGDILVISESFDYTENFCTHLPWHKGKGGDFFLNYLNKIGFKKLELEHFIHPTIHIKL